MKDRQLTPNFWLREFLDTPTMPEVGRRLCWEKLTTEIERNILRIATIAQVVRDHFKKPLKISSGFRPEVWEKLNGRSGNSQHTKGWAIDFSVPGVDLLAVFNWTSMTFSKGGRAISRKGGFVHYDLRPDRAEWDYDPVA